MSKQKELYFVVEGQPQGKERPRFNAATRRAYTPSKTRHYESLVKWTYKKHFGTEQLIKPVQAFLVAYYKIPKSATKKRVEAMLNGTERPTGKPDLDNVAKVILDSLNGLAYKDDSAVVDLQVQKYYAEQPRVEITLIEQQGA